MAAVHRDAASQWPFDENNEQNIALNQRSATATPITRGSPITASRRCGSRSRTPRCPPGCTCRPITSMASMPAVVSIPGMDSFKEASVALYGDRWLIAGIAVLAVDGPGQYEAPLLGIRVSMANWIEAGPALIDWMRDATGNRSRQRIGVVGAELRLVLRHHRPARNEPRLPRLPRSRRPVSSRAATRSSRRRRRPSSSASCTWRAIPTRRAFDRIREDADLGRPRRTNRVPYLCVAGETRSCRHSSHTEKRFAQLKAPKRLVVYQDAGTRPRRRAVRATGPEPAGADRGLDAGAARRQALPERALARAVERQRRQVTLRGVAARQARACRTLSPERRLLGLELLRP